MQKILFFVFSLGLCSCQTVATIPVGHTRAPEVSGRQLGIGIGATYNPGRAVYIVPDSSKGSQTLPVKSGSDFNPNTVDGSSYFPLSLALELNFLNRISFFLDQGVGAQWQFWGATAYDAEKGSLSASLIYDYSQSSVSVSGGTGIALGDGTNLYNGSQNVNSNLFGLLVGYRFFQDAGFGLNIFEQQIGSTGNGIISPEPFVATGSTQYLSGSFNDIGVGPSFFYSNDNWQVVINPIFLTTKEPVRNQSSTLTVITAKVIYVLDDFIKKPQQK